MNTGLVWYRNDLRSQDNISLKKAVEENDRVIAVYFFDPKQFSQTKFGFKKTEKYRAQFLIETVESLSTNLNNINVTLLVFHSETCDPFPPLEDCFLSPEPAAGANALPP